MGAKAANMQQAAAPAVATNALGGKRASGTKVPGNADAMPLRIQWWRWILDFTAAASDPISRAITSFR